MKRGKGEKMGKVEGLKDGKGERVKGGKGEKMGKVEG